MLSTAKNYDVICLQMRQLMPHLDSAIKGELSKLLVEIKDVLVIADEIKPFLDKKLPVIFNFRVKAIKWLIEEQKFDFSVMWDTIHPQVEDLKQNPRLEILAENGLFALRCNKRVVNALIGSGNISKANFFSNITGLPAVTYTQFLATLAYSAPDDEAAQKLVDWVNASLYIEFIILSAVIINQEKIEVTDKVINELAFLVADAAQEYSAIAIELGIMKHHSASQNLFSGIVDKSFMKEQKELANTGLNDLAEIF